MKYAGDRKCRILFLLLLVGKVSSFQEDSSIKSIKDQWNFSRLIFNNYLIELNEIKFNVARNQSTQLKSRLFAIANVCIFGLKTIESLIDIFGIS